MVDHDGKTYLVTRSTGAARRTNKAFVSFATGDGQPLAFDAVAPFLPEKRVSAKQIAAGLDHPENHVMQRDYDLANIAMVKFRGQLYKLVG